MKYEDFWNGLQAVCPDVDVARAKKLCDGMVNVFADNYMQGDLKRSEFFLVIAIAVVHTLVILDEDR